MNEQIGSVKEHRIDRSHTETRSSNNSGEGYQRAPNRIGDGNVELLKRPLPKQSRVFPRER